MLSAIDGKSPSRTDFRQRPERSERYNATGLARPVFTGSKLVHDLFLAHKQKYVNSPRGANAYGSFFQLSPTLENTADREVSE